MTRLLLPGVALALAIASQVSAPGGATDDVLTKSRALYGSLKSYADVGTVLHEYGTSDLSRHTFKTYYRAPRHFYFEFNEDKADGGGVLAIWCEGADFQSWWTDTRVHSTYPPGKGNAAFAMAHNFSVGSAIQIPSMLFAAAGLTGTMGELADMKADGIEPIGGRPAHKFVGVASSKYGATGHVLNVRAATVWIDVETRLVRRIFEDTPKGLPVGVRNRITTTFEPQLNPTLEDGRFRFVVPPR